MLLAIELHDMVDVGLEPFLRDVQIRNIAKDRRLGIYIRHLVARAQLEGMGTADSLSDGRVHHGTRKSIPLIVDQVRMNSTYSEENNPWTRSKPRCAALRLSCRWLP